MNGLPTLRGVVHGRTIELDQDAGLPDGQSVAIIVRPLETTANWGEGLQRSFGGWADDADDLDEYLNWSRQQRKQSRSEGES